MQFDCLNDKWNYIYNSIITVKNIKTFEFNYIFNIQVHSI